MECSAHLRNNKNISAWKMMDEQLNATTNNGIDAARSAASMSNGVAEANACTANDDKSEGAHNNETNNELMRDRSHKRQ